MSDNFDRHAFNRALSVAVWTLVGLAYIVVCAILLAREPWIGLPVFIVGLFGGIAYLAYRSYKGRLK